MIEYIADPQTLLIGETVEFEASTPPKSSCVYHEDNTGVFILKGITDQCFATYQVTFHGNIAVPTGQAVTPIAVAISVSGSPKLSSRAVVTPAAVEEYFNVTSTTIIRVPKGCCFNVSVVPVSPTDGIQTAPSTLVQDGNLIIERVA